MTETKRGSKTVRFTLVGLLIVILVIATMLAGFRIGYRDGYSEGVATSESEHLRFEAYNVFGLSPDEDPKEQLSRLKLEVMGNTGNPESWRDLGGPGFIAVGDESLVVYQTGDVHFEIAAYLSAVQAGETPPPRVVRERQKSPLDLSPLLENKPGKRKVRNPKFRQYDGGETEPASE